MTHRGLPALGIAAATAAALTAGCGGPQLPPIGVVEGTVTISGETEAGIGVAFVPARREKGPNPSSTGVTDSDGRYRLQYSIPNDRDPGNPTFGAGAVVGEHKVMVTDHTMLSEMLPPPGRVPREYTNIGKTPLRFEVTPGEQTIDIEL